MTMTELALSNLSISTDDSTHNNKGEKVLGFNSREFFISYDQSHWPSSKLTAPCPRPGARMFHCRRQG